MSGKTAPSNNVAIIQDFPFDFIARASARYMCYSTDALHPMAIAHPDKLESWRNLITLYEAWGKAEQAEE